MVRVLFFGRLRDAMGVREIDVSEAVQTIDELRALIARKHPELGAALSGPGIRVVVDQAIVRGDVSLAAALEVAFLPPLSGG